TATARVSSKPVCRLHRSPTYRRLWPRQPVIDCRGCCLEMNDDNLRGCDQLPRTVVIRSTQLLTGFSRWLGQLDADTGQFGGESLSSGVAVCSEESQVSDLRRLLQEWSISRGDIGTPATDNAAILQDIQE